ncbi:MAG: hypothetical protein ACE37F_25455 [Nannocystaceae bacterium]|nr:hypothetical protein [bacterium]
MPEFARRHRGLPYLLGAATLLGAAFPVGCRPKPTRVPALCSFDGLSEEERTSQALAPITWLTLVSPTVDRQSMARSGSLTNACGQVLPAPFSSETFSCPGYESADERVASDLVEETDMIMDSAGEDRMLLWAATDEYASGEVEGAAALALWTEDAVEVHAAGRLRGYRTGARMKLHDIGGVPVLILNSDRCDADNRCDAITQVVPIINRQFTELPLWESDRGCIGRAQFVLDRREERDLGNGTIRRFVLTRSIELTDEGIFVNDLLRMDDKRANAPEAEPKPFRKVSARRPLLLAEDRLMLEDEGLWARSLRDHGQVDPSSTAEDG